jgi:putative ABC transport system permease protein
VTGAWWQGEAAAVVSALLRKSITDLTHRRARTLFTVMTLALAVASVGIFGLPPLMDRAMQREIVANRLADLTIQLKPLALTREDLGALERIHNVAAVEPRSAFRTRMYIGERRAEALVIGVRDFARQRADVVTVASGTAPAAGRVLTDVQDARRDLYNGRAGDVARVMAADGSVRRLEISGSGRNLEGGQAGTEGTVVLYAGAPTVAALSGERGYGTLVMRLRDRDRAAVDRTVAAVGQRLASMPGFAGFTALPEVRAAGDWPGRQELDDFSTIFSIVTALALLSALVLIASTMSTLISEQAGEIATMKAIGARRRQIAGIYMRTTLLLGALGTVVGSILGIVVANLLVGFFGREFFAIEPGVGIDAGILAAGCAVGLLGPPLAALPAVRRGSRATIREALQDTGAAPVGQGPLEAALRHATFLPRSAQIGLAGVTRRARRSVVTVLQVGLAVATMLGILGLGSGVAATVHGSWSDHGWNIWLGAEGRPFDARAGQILRSVLGVAAAEPILSGEVELRGEPAFTWGVAADTMFRYRLADGTWYGPGQERAAARVAVVERNLARATGIRVGDVARLRTPAGPASLRVIGISSNQQEEGTVVFVPLTTARALARDPEKANGYWVRTLSADHAAIDRVATRVEDALVAHGYPTSTEITYVAERDEAAAYRTITTSIAVLGFLVIAIGLVGLVNTITMNVLERTREIGILRCIGARARDVRRVFAIEGLALVVAGWLVGVPLGYALDRFLVWLVRESINVHVDFAFPLWHVPLALAGALVLALAVMALPVRRAVRFRPGEALRYA